MHWTRMEGWQGHFYIDLDVQTTKDNRLNMRRHGICHAQNDHCGIIRENTACSYCLERGVVSEYGLSLMHLALRLA